jgi:hypothetical protein
MKLPASSRRRILPGPIHRWSLVIPAAPMSGISASLQQVAAAPKPLWRRRIKKAEPPSYQGSPAIHSKRTVTNPWLSVPVLRQVWLFLEASTECLDYVFFLIRYLKRYVNVNNLPDNIALSVGFGKVSLLKRLLRIPAIYLTQPH